MDTQNPQNTSEEFAGDNQLTSGESTEPERSASPADAVDATADATADAEERHTTPDTEPNAEGPGEQAAIPGEQAAIPGEQAAIPGEQAAIPGEQAAIPDERDGLAKTEPLSTRIGADAPPASDAETPADAGAPLAEGTLIGGYRIVESVLTDAQAPVYLAEPADTTTQPEEEYPGLRYVVRELAPDEATDHLAHIVAMGLRHPVLLTPVALAREGGRLFLVSMEIADEKGNVVPPMSVGERLRPVDALRAGIELADGLATMHRNGLAHLHISPEEVTLYEGRIYLSGVGHATVAGPDEEEAKPLFARDANFLARTLGTIGGVFEAAPLEDESSAKRSLREIAQRGEAGTFTKAEELAESFALTLQALAAAGAEMGADLRSVRLAVTADAISSVGLVRSANQDAYGLASFNIHDDAAADAPVGVFLVADGMGGEAHGEIASRLVARAVTAEMTRQFTLPVTLWPTLTVADPEAAVMGAPKTPLAQALELAVKEANRQTRAFGQRLKATTGSTVTALAFSGARAAIAHLGDSRAYLLRDNQLLQLTEDHSLLARMEAIKHPLLEDPSFVVPRSVLYRSVGQEDDISPDMMEFVVLPGDRILLCSDGLWDELPAQVIGQVMAEAATPRACAAELVALANAAGGNDNSTAVAVFFDSEPEDDAIMRRGARIQMETTEESDETTAAPAAEADSEPPSDAVE